MSNDHNAELDFIFPEPLSLRAISQQWLNSYAEGLENPEFPGLPNTEAALTKVLEHLYDRVGANAKEDVPAMVFIPGNDTDPYVIGIPLDQHSAKMKRQIRNPGNTPPPKNTVEVIERSLREEFEDLLFQEGNFEPNVVERQQGERYGDRYVIPWVNARWEGFQMYHRRMINANVNNLRNKHTKTLGRYVVGKVANNGAALFSKSPYRHNTRAQAMEEANRLSAEFDSPFAIFRCLDIVDVNR